MALRLEAVMQLKDSEEVRAILRQHLAVLFAPLAAALFFLVLPFFLLFFLFSFGVWGVVIFIVLLTVGIFLSVRTIAIWGSNALVVTNKRLLHLARPGVFSRHVSELPLSSAVHISWRRHGLFQTVFRAGTVFIQGTNGGPKLSFKHLSDPRGVVDLIQDLRDQPTRAPVTNVHPDRQAAIRRVVSLLEQLDTDDLSVVERKLRKRIRQTAMDAVLTEEED